MFNSKLIEIIEKISAWFTFPEIAEDLPEEVILHRAMWNYYPYMV
jgi:hypothetical protein